MRSTSHLRQIIIISIYIISVCGSRRIFPFHLFLIFYYFPHIFSLKQSIFLVAARTSSFSRLVLNVSLICVDNWIRMRMTYDSCHLATKSRGCWTNGFENSVIDYTRRIISKRITVSSNVTMWVGLYSKSNSNFFKCNNTSKFQNSSLPPRISMWVE